MKAILITLACTTLVCATGHAQLELKVRVTEVTRITPIIDQAKDVYHIKRADKPPVIDGKADEWQNVPAMVLEAKNGFLGASWDGHAGFSGAVMRRGSVRSFSTRQRARAAPA